GAAPEPADPRGAARALLRAALPRPLGGAPGGGRGERPGVGAAVRGPAVPGRAQGPPGHRGPAHLVRAAAALTARVPSAARRASARSRLAPAPDRRPRPPPGGERTRHRSGRSPARRSGPPSASAPASRSAPRRGARAGGPGRGALPRRSRAGVTFGPPRPGARLCPPPAGGGWTGGAAARTTREVP